LLRIPIFICIMNRKSLYILIFVLFSVYGSSAKVLTYKPDTIYLSKGYYIKINKKVIKATNDTIIVLPDTLNYKISPVSFNKSESFYDSLQVKADRNKLTKELYSLVFRPTSKSKVPDTVEVIKSEDLFKPYSGKIINKIIIKKLDVFGPTITDTSAKPLTWVGKQGNKIHVQTKDFVIRENLLFKKGESINPYVIAENEHILRELPFIDNANIIVVPVSEDSVDVLVVTKDFFPYGINITTKKINETDVQIWNENFLGLGHKISSTLAFVADSKPMLVYNRGEYRVNNISGSFIDGKVYFERDDLEKKYAIDLNRAFVPYKIRNAGGLSLIKSNDYTEVQTNEDNSKLYEVEYILSDVYYGHDFKFFNPGLENGKESFLVALARFTNKHYIKRPFVLVDSNQNFHSYSRLLGSVGVSKNKYYSTDYVFSYGRTEDIPYGYQIKFTGGYEWGEFLKRTYLGFKVCGGEYFNPIGYFSALLNVGGFIKNKQMEDASLYGKFAYMMNLIKLKNTQIRNFFSVNYTLGINQSSNDFISLSEDVGFTDVGDGILNGQQRLVFSVNSVTYLPFSLYGFRFSTFTFADFGFIGSNEASIFNQSLYSSLGFGVRFKNENLVISAIELRVTFYPKPIPGYENTNFSFEKYEVSSFSDFKMGKPSVIGFN
jgi:hypothetical protein